MRSDGVNLWCFCGAMRGDDGILWVLNFGGGRRSGCRRDGWSGVVRDEGYCEANLQTEPR
jgi:hypothetical protein